MKIRTIKAGVLSFLVSMFSLMATTTHAEELKDQILDRLVTAILTNDYQLFLADGTREFRNALSPLAFSAVANQFRGLDKAGYSSEYLTDLTQNGQKVYLWKLKHQNREDEILAKLVLVENNVAGFWLQ